MGSLQALSERAHPLQLPVDFDAEAGKGRRHLLDLAGDLLLQRSQAALRRVDGLLKPGAGLVQHAALLGLHIGRALQTIVHLHLQGAHVVVEPLLLVLQCAQPGLQVAVSRVGGLLLHTHLLLELGKAPLGLLQGVLRAPQLRRLPLGCLLQCRLAEARLLLPGLDLLLELPVPLLRELRPARPSPEALIQTLDAARQRLRLLNEASNATLDLRPFLPAVTVPNALLDPGLQLPFQLREAPPVGVVLPLKSGDDDVNPLREGGELVLNHCVPRVAPGRPDGGRASVAWLPPALRAAADGRVDAVVPATGAATTARRRLAEKRG
mmetsp:Transcript_45663/g.136484  ORF Transcript_45663/g.136484 Transcript_45663/m.136484 type:complete len:323 (+) Transcript_45663:2191-3159(+)